MLVLCEIVLSPTKGRRLLNELDISLLSDTEAEYFIVNGACLTIKHIDLTVAKLGDHLDAALRSLDFAIGQYEYPLFHIDIELCLEKLRQRTVKISGFGLGFDLLYFFEGEFDIFVILFVCIFLSTEPFILFTICYN